MTICIYLFFRLGMEHYNIITIVCLHFILPSRSHDAVTKCYYSIIYFDFIYSFGAMKFNLEDDFN